MPGVDTSMGGDETRFPTGGLTTILQAGDGREHLERVANTYWKPVYCYIRRAWSKSDADAKDLTQSFLLHLVKSDVIGRFDAARGNFRAYLKQCLKNFLSMDARDSDRLKRGGGARPLPLDGAVLDVPAPTGTPDEEFDRDWTREVVDRCLRDIEAHYRARRQSVYFDVLRLYAIEADADAPPSYRDVADRLHISESDVRNHLRFARRELRQRVIQVIGEYVADRDAALAELAGILGDTD